MNSLQCPYANAMYVSLPGELFSVTQVKLEMTFLVLLFGCVSPILTGALFVPVVCI